MEKTSLRCDNKMVTISVQTDSASHTASAPLGSDPLVQHAIAIDSPQPPSGILAHIDETVSPPKIEILNPFHTGPLAFQIQAHEAFEVDDRDLVADSLYGNGVGDWTLPSKMRSKLTVFPYVDACPHGAKHKSALCIDGCATGHHRLEPTAVGGKPLSVPDQGSPAEGADDG